MKKIIEMKHHKDDYECMWNGIEDIYVNKTKEEIPNQLFFCLCGLGNFVYLKTNKKEIKRLVSFGDGRTKKMYEYLHGFVGFDYKHFEFKTFEQLLQKAKTEINLGYPVVLGAMDMYYLEYYSKLYQKDHIPFHYVLMIGYDDELEQIFLYDCGKDETIHLSYENLKLALDVESPGLSKKNTLCTVRMENPKNLIEIVESVLYDSATKFLKPTNSFTGCKGLEKVAHEIDSWECEIGVDETKKILRNMIFFFGTVPSFPNRLINKNESESMRFCGGRDKFANLLADLSKKYKRDNWMKASLLFQESSIVFESLTNHFIDYILGISVELHASEMLMKINYYETQAYQLILNENE